MRNVLLVAVLAITTSAALIGAGSPVWPTAPDGLGPGGIHLVSDEPRRVPLTGEGSDALAQGQQLASSEPEVYGYAWYDTVSGQPTLDVAADAATSAASRLAASTPGKSLTTRRVKRSQATLEQIKHDAIELARDKRFSDVGIHVARIDPRGNRVVLVVNKITEALATELLARYGVEAIAVQEEPRPDSMPFASRQADTSPFFGGAAIDGGGCTVAFPWYSGSTSMMVTAGHCKPLGGPVTVPAYSLGSVTATSEENWNTSTGTQYLTGQSVYRGDIALIRVVAGRSSGSKMYVGGPTSTTSRVVGEMWSRSPALEDHFCIGGSKAGGTGEICEWVVRWPGVDVSYGSAIVRNTNESWPKSGPCTIAGDSGAPVYTVRTDGKVAAKGIFSGGGSNALTGKCWVNFTDIREAYFGFPGQLRLG